jgi:hypothetical protein
MDTIMEIGSMIRESGNGGLWAVTQVALMPCTRAFDYDYEHRPPRRTELEHAGILWSRKPERYDSASPSSRLYANQNA